MHTCIRTTVLTGIPDSIELTQDPDQDCVPSFLDLDSDGDLILDEVEMVPIDGEPIGIADTDYDGIPDFIDVDSDNDGIPDILEGSGDVDQDGVGNWRDLDSDGDLISDKVEGEFDIDYDNIPDRLDLDSDNDNLPDITEGVPNWRIASNATGRSPQEQRRKKRVLVALDSDGDGLLDSYEGGGDADGDTIPNFLDLDSDAGMLNPTWGLISLQIPNPS